MKRRIDGIETHATAIKNGEHESVRPGLPWEFSEACQPGDGCWQGDLVLEIVACVPQGYVKVSKPTKADAKLVPGETQGSRHCLDSLAGVTLYRPEEWDAESLQGPCFVLAKRRKVIHPTHGAVTIPAGFTVLCRYQREWEKELQRERRARD